MTFALLRPVCLLALSLPALAFAQTSTLDKIKQSGSMTLAYRESSIPFCLILSSVDACAKASPGRLSASRQKGRSRAFVMRGPRGECG